MQRLWFESYLKAIEGSVDSNIFRTFLVEEDGGTSDVFNDGELSCGYHVSAVLALFDQQEKAHATVSSTIKDLEEHGWQKLDPESTLEPGDVIVWEDMEFVEEPGVLHPHIGFYIGSGEAVSNDYRVGTPQKHPLKSKDRAIKVIYRGKDQFAKLPQPS
jgi:hypothetical protein